MVCSSLAFALASVAPFGRKAEVLCRLVEFVAGYGNRGSRQVTLTGAGGGGRTGDE